MPETQASIGYGSVLELAPFEDPTAFEYVSEVRNFSLPSPATDQQQATHMQSPNKTHEYVPGMTDPGEFGCEMNYIPGSASDLLMLAAKGKRKRVRITAPNGVQVLFTGSRQTYEKTAETEGVMTASVSFKVSGEPIQTPPTAPRAISAPTITAATNPPEIGAPIEIDRGIWAGAQDWSVKWQRGDLVDGPFTDITGATGLAYVPGAADEDKFLRAVVTGINDSFQTEVATDPLAAAVIDPNAEE